MDRWDFVFIQFKSKDRAIEAREKLAELSHFRVRYAVPEEKETRKLLQPSD